MKILAMILLPLLLSMGTFAQKNNLKNPPSYQIFNESVDKLLPSIPISNKAVSGEKEVSEKLTVESFQKTEEKNDINIEIEIIKYISNPLNANPMAGFFKTARTLDQQLSLNAMAVTILEENAKDAIEKKEKGRVYAQINLDPEEASDYRTKRGGEKMKKKEFGMNLDAMFNYNNSLVKGSFHDAEGKWNLGKEYRHFYYAAAGNVLVKVEVYAHKTPADKSPDAKAIANGILAKLPHDQNFSVESGFEVYPRMNVTVAANETGLIPASSLLPAKIIFTVGKPNINVNFALMVNGVGELRANNQSGKSLDVTSDGKGEATVWYYYTDTKEVTAPLDVQVVAESEGKSRKAHVNVGLGLAFDQLTAIPEQVYEYAPSKPYAFALSVKSRFFPQLDVAMYLKMAHDSKIWGDYQVGIELVSTWVNEPKGGPKDDLYVGTTSIIPIKFNSSHNILSANTHPMAYYTDNSYPAVNLNSEGTHIYRITGEINVLDGTTPEKRRIAEMREKMLKTDALIPLSSIYPERWYKSLICSLSTVDSDKKWFILEAVKLIPAYGMIADASTTASSVLCSLMDGNYEKSILDLAAWLGGQYIDHLMDAEVFNALSKRSQDAVLAAKTTYFGTDMYKKKGELEEIRAKQGK